MDSTSIGMFGLSAPQLTGIGAVSLALTGVAYFVYTKRHQLNRAFVVNTVGQILMFVVVVTFLNYPPFREAAGTLGSIAFAFMVYPSIWVTSKGNKIRRTQKERAAKRDIDVNS